MNTDERTDEELNRMIAEWCGWRCDQIHVQGIPDVTFTPPGKEFNPWKNASEFPPNYCHDLNACHEAEGKLSDDQHEAFRCALSVESDNGGWPKTIILRKERDIVSATARQRAEALVRVIESQKGEQR